ncbi:hypothetical protein C5473_19170 [Leptospira interrogans serovar Weerasinghe]|nr:hypothetical protein C5473_19170 [Leptospira interrogans serovar Weerasinghe]
MNKCSPMSHKIHYRKLIVVSFKKNILEALNVYSTKDLHGTAFENHLSVLLNCTTALFSKLLGLIDSRVL